MDKSWNAIAGSMRQLHKITTVKSRKGKKKEAKDKEEGYSCINNVLEKWKKPRPPHNSAEPQSADFVLEVCAFLFSYFTMLHYSLCRKQPQTSKIAYELMVK